MLNFVIKLMQPFALQKACMRCKSEGGIDIIFFRADNNIPCVHTWAFFSEKYLS